MEKIVYKNIFSKRYINFFICIFFIIAGVLMISFIVRSAKIDHFKKVQAFKQRVYQQQQNANMLKQNQPEYYGQQFRDQNKKEILDYFLDDAEEYSEEEYTDYYETEEKSGFLSNIPFISWFETDDHNLEDMTPTQLNDALDRIIQLETKLQNVELNLNKNYPKVATLGMQDKKRILVAGGAGFVGSHLVDRLLVEGNHVIVMDDFSTGRQKNINQWVGHPNLEVIHQDIINPVLLEVDQIYHLANSNIGSSKTPLKIFKTMTLGCINLLGLAKHGAARILIGSSSDVYGAPDVEPQQESYLGRVDPTGPLSARQEGNRVQEALGYAYARQEKVTVRVARIYNTYGPRMKSDGPLGALLKNALQGKSVSVAGLESRSFLYVADLVEGLVRLMNSNYSKPLNFGDPQHHHIQNVADLVKAVTGVNESVTKMEENDNIKQYPSNGALELKEVAKSARVWPDIEMAQSKIGWTPKVSLEEGLAITWNYLTTADDKLLHEKSIENMLQEGNEETNDIHVSDNAVENYSMNDVIQKDPGIQETNYNLVPVNEQRTIRHELSEETANGQLFYKNNVIENVPVIQKTNANFVPVNKK